VKEGDRIWAKEAKIHSEFTRKLIKQTQSLDSVTVTSSRIIALLKII
jgi:hypothetical protein